MRRSAASRRSSSSWYGTDSQAILPAHAPAQLAQSCRASLLHVVLDPLLHQSLRNQRGLKAHLHMFARGACLGLVFRLCAGRLQGLQHCQDTMVGDEGAGGGVRGVSGGERKRVTVGVGLVTQPRVLMLDEPTSGLDSETAVAIIELMQDLARQVPRPPAGPSSSSCRTSPDGWLAPPQAHHLVSMATA